MNYTFSLPTFLVVVIIVILFRILDKRNRSLEKVKRFSDKLKEEISVFIKEKTVEINDIAVDLDLNLKKSREILKRILTFEEALKAKEGDFKNMKLTVNKYAGTLDELVAMSERVDENLKRIKDESIFIDKVGSEVKNISARITKLETALDTTLAKSNEKNKTELDKIRKKLLDTHRDNIEELENSLNTMENRVTNIHEYVKKLEERRGEVLKTAEKAYHELLARLDEEISKKRKQGTKDLSEEIDSLIGQAVENREQITRELESMLAETHDTVKNLDEEFTFKIEDFKEQYAQIEKMYHEQLEKAAVRGETFNDEVFAQLKASIDKKAKSQAKEVLEYFNKVSSDLDVKKKEIGEMFGVLRSDANVWHVELDKQMKDLHRQIAERLKGLEAEITYNMNDYLTQAKETQEHATAEMDDFVKAVEQRLGEYEEELTYKFRKLEDANVDIEALEKSLRTYMDSITSKIKTDFNGFTKLMEDERMAQKVKADEELQQINSEIENIEAEVNGLKAKAYENVSENLKILENDFFTNLKERSETIQNRLESFQEDINTQIHTIKQMNDANMDEYIKTVEQRLDEYQEEVKYKIQKLEDTNVDIDALEKSLRTYMSSITDKIKADFHNFTKLLEDEREAQRAKAEEELQLINSEIENIEAEVKGLKAKAYENVSEKLVLLEDNFFTDLKERSEAIQNRLESFQEDVNTQVESIKQENDTNIESIAKECFKDKTAELKDFIEASLKQTEKELLGYFSGTKNEAETWHEEILQKYKDSELSLSERVQEFIERSNFMIEELRQDFEEQKNKLIDATNKERSDLGSELEKLLEKSSHLSQNISEIEKQQKNFIAQTKIFERADSLKLSLENDISAMKKELIKISAYKKDMDAIAKEFFTTKKLVDDVSAKIRDFVTEKKRINSMETDFKRLIALSQEIDVKVANITTSYDAVQDLELKMRSVEELEKDIDSRFERLEKKKKVLDSTTQGVDKNFQKLTLLENNIGEMHKEMKGIPQLIKELSEEVNTIAENKEKADTVVEKMENIDNLILELEARMDKLNIARDWLARAETRLEKVNSQAQEQLRLLESLIKEEVAQIKKDRGAPSVDKRQTVVKLAHQGWSVQEIARATKLSRGEVELILELIPEK
jgi:chromosome segregation ATPase